MIKTSFFVDGVTGVEELRDRAVAEDGGDLFRGQRFFSVIALDEVFTNDFAQETPRITTGCSSALVPKIDIF